MLAIPGAGHARVCWGRWLVDCASPYCTGALTLGPDRPDGRGRIRRGLTWGQQRMGCWDCDYVTGPIFWPPDPDAIEMLLRRRPDVATRNWAPPETVEDLLVENVAYGLLPRELDLDGPSTALMQTINGRVVGGLLLDALPDAEARRQLTTGGN